MAKEGKKKPTVEVEDEGGVAEVTIAIPVHEPPAGVYHSNHVETRLTSHQATALRYIYDGLRAARARLADGRYVDSAASVVRWLLERVADELGK